VEDIVEEIEHARKFGIINIEENDHIYSHKCSNLLTDERKPDDDDADNNILFDIATD
jgi:hypothetical protein